MHCEFCDCSFADLAEARKHMLTIEHIRAKRNIELSSTKYVELMRQATIHPKNFYQLTKLLNLHSKNDVNALEKQNFFKITTKTNWKVVHELMSVLYQSSIDYHVGSLPNELRQPLIEIIERQNSDDNTTANK